MKIVVVGGTGILGTELKKIDDTLICIGSEYDIFSFDKLSNFLDEIDPDIILNCAAIKSGQVDKDPIDSININIIGSSNLSKYCIIKNKRLVYISTDYVYAGITGNYSETDEVLPQNKYAWTKLAGEVPVLLVSDHLIIRTSFGETVFPYKQAYDNLFTSKDYVDIIAPMILDVTKSDVTGIINIGTSRKSLFEFANKRNDIPPSSLETTKDFSLNTKKYKKYTILHNKTII